MTMLTDRPARRAQGRSVLREIADRRRSDLTVELAGTTLRELGRAAAAGPEPRPVALRLARPGLHVIAEIKRRSPSAGSLSEAPVDVADRARAYAAGGASMISVLVEPHWFGGSIDDLAVARAATSIPVLAKEFVVDPRQLPLLRAAGADAVLLLAALHRAPALARLVRRALDLGLEPLVEVHDARELDAALATCARLIGVNNRDLRTLVVDTTSAETLRTSIPHDRIVIAESGVRQPALLRRWRALGFDAALIGEDLMRAGTDRAAVTARVAAFVSAGAVPRPGQDPAADGRMPLVKICGVTDARGVHAAIAAGADAIGLNMVPGTKRALSESEVGALIAVARTAAAPGNGPRLVGIFANRPAGEVAGIAARIGLDAVQLHGSEPPEALDAIPLPVIKALHLPPMGEGSGDTTAAASGVVDLAESYRAKPNLWTILLDTADPTVPGGTGKRAATDVAAAVAARIPVILAGGLTAANVAEALLAIPAIGVDTAGGVEPLGGKPGRPSKDPVRVALFLKRARGARLDLPAFPFGPRPVDAGILEPDARGRWGRQRQFGGRYVPETLMAALLALEGAYLLDQDRARLLGGASRARPAVHRSSDRSLSCRSAGRGAGASSRSDTGQPASLPQARGPRPHRRPQDQQRPRSGAPHPAAGQVPGHRGDRCRPARRRDRDRVRAPGPRVCRLHGCRGHPAPGAERAPDACPGHRGARGDLRHGHAQGRHQRGDARLGHERRDDPLRARVGGRAASVSRARA